MFDEQPDTLKIAGAVVNEAVTSSVSRKLRKLSNRRRKACAISLSHIFPSERVYHKVDNMEAFAS